MFLKETEKWEDGVYQLEVTDPVMGGENGIDNVQAKQLANRTLFLKANKQDKNTTLSAIAALSLTANKFFYVTDTGAIDVATLSPFARTLLECIDAVAAQTILNSKTTIPDYMNGISRSYDVVYQAQDNIYVIANMSGSYANGCALYVGDTSSPTTILALAGDDIGMNTKMSTVCGVIPAGYYWKVGFCTIGANSSDAFEIMQDIKEYKLK